MEHWNRTKIPSGEYQAMNEQLGDSVQNIPGTNISVPYIVDEHDILSLSLEELLEVTGCHVAQCGAFNALYAIVSFTIYVVVYHSTNQRNDLLIVSFTTYVKYCITLLIYCKTIY